jgi:hypothetical protein
MVYVVLLICYFAASSMGERGRFSLYFRSMISDDTTELDWDRGEHWVVNARPGRDPKSKAHSQEWLCYWQGMRAHRDDWMDYFRFEI